MKRKIINLSALIAAIVAFSATVFADGPNASPEKERELLGILTSDAPKAEKAIACKQLAVYGSSQAVPELAKLLTDPELASWARIPLEVIPGAEADEALRKATEAVQGRLLVGTINSIGVRRDAGAVSALTARVKDADGDVASAAAVALGNIGNAEATKALRESLKTAAPKVRSAVAEGCVLCAERSLSEGRADEAAAIYDEVRNAEVPKQRVLEATRGAILSRKKEGVALLIEQLKSTDESFFQIALTTARELSGDEVDQSLAAELANAAPERAALIVVAMADRRGSVVLPAIVKAATSGPKQVRIAAINALGRVGDVSTVPTLLQCAVESDAEVVAASKTALTDLSGANVDQAIVGKLNDADGKTYALLVELVGTRRIAATDALLKAVENKDSAVRTAALKALGATIPAKNLSVLISQAVSPKNPEDAQVAREALKEACVRMPDREAVAAELAAALNRSPAPAKVALLETIGAVGGTKSLQTLASAAKTTDAQMQDISTRLLGEWMTIDAAPVLLDLSKSAPGDKYQVRALRGYIRIARQFVMPQEQRVEMCAKAFDASRHPAEQKLVLEVLKRYPSAEMLNIAMKALQVPELKEDAAQAALVIAQKSKGVDVRDLLSKIGMDKVKVQIVKAEYGAGTTQKDVTEALQKVASDSPLISLASPSYNASFGGDPAPGSVKQLKVQYKMNGKQNEAAFAEDALILLPMPK